MALEDYLAIVKRWWWLILAAMLVASASSYLAVARVPRVYQATTTVMVGQSLQKTNPTHQDFSISQQLAQTYAHMVSRQPILTSAAEALGLPYVPWEGNVSARTVPGTQLLEISVRDSDPRRAQALADEIARQLIRQSPTESVEDRARRAFVQGQLGNLQENIQDTEAEIEAEQEKLDAANSARAIQQYQGNISALQQKLASYQATYASLLQTVQGGTNYISVVEAARLPRRPISPQVAETVLLAAAIGLALALGGAFLIEYLDDTVKTPDDVTRAVDLPTLGTIARIEGKAYGDKLVAARAPRSSTAEAFRALRTNVRYSEVDRPLRTLMVTSPNPIEGKSVVLANLAVVMAQAGRAVILVDADLRRPMQHKIFGLDNFHGLSDVIVKPNPSLPEHLRQLELNALSELFSGDDGGAVAEHARATGIGRLRLLTSGPLPPNPADLLGSERMAALIRMLEQEADLVLFDTPPALAVTDAVALASQVDGVLLVNDAGRTRRATARRAVERLRQVEANLLGVVLNRLSPGGDDDYAYQHYYGRENGQRAEGRRRWWPLSWPLFGRGGDNHRPKGTVVEEPESATEDG